MTTRKERLRKLVDVQEKLKALHETRHAGFVSAAMNAQGEAEDLMNRFDAEDSLSPLFPALYSNRIEKALSRSQENKARAKVESANVATATARTNMVERAYREVRQRDERETSDRERLEMIERKHVGNDK
jgi:hypothetical protein